MARVTSNRCEAQRALLGRPLVPPEYPARRDLRLRRACNQVDQDSDQREDEDQQDPTRLPPSRKIGASEDVSEHRDEQPNAKEQKEERNHCDQEIAQGEIG